MKRRLIASKYTQSKVNVLYHKVMFFREGNCAFGDHEKLRTFLISSHRVSVFPVRGHFFEEGEEEADGNRVSSKFENVCEH